MSAVNNKWIKWQKVIAIGMLCGLAVTGCSRSDETDATDDIDATEADAQAAADNSAVAPAVACDDPLVQDRLKNALKNTLNQQAQGFAANYANTAEVSLDGGAVSSKVNAIVIDVQNAAILQEANANGMTTCQASVSMTLPSEDLYQASQVHAANNLASLQTRLAEDNIRINNNMLIDDAFTYVVGTQAGQVQVRIAGQPALIAVVADVMASSAFKTVIDNQQRQRQAQQAARSRAAQNANENQSSRQPTQVTPAAPAAPIAPAQPAQPATPPTIDQSGSQTSVTPSSKAPAATAAKPAAAVPKDDSIDMVIIEDESATY